jgi:5-methylcytosine-specific restriction endonuclease McrA
LESEFKYKEMKKVYKVKKTKSIQQLKKLADKVVSEYIRRRDKGVCFTCGNTKEWKYQQAGHFVSRVYGNLRYYEKNINCQCYVCNVMRHGNMDEYAIKLQRKYGPGILEELNKFKKMPTTPFKWTDLNLLINLYKQKIKEL